MQVFISHSHSDSPLAARVSRALRKAGLQVWDPDLHLFPGDNWPAQVGRALEESDAMVVLLTPNSVSSPHVKAEMAYALGSKTYSNRLMVRGRELGVSEAKVVVGVPDGNQAYRERITSSWFARTFPNRTVSDIVRETLLAPDSTYASVSQSTLADAVREHCADGATSWSAYHRVRYGW